MRRLAVIALLGLAVAGCVTPSIPIPPPDPAKMVFQLTVVGTTSTTTFTYPPDEHYVGGVAYLYNRDTGMGVIQKVSTNGSVGPTQPFGATLGNQIVFSVENDAQTVSTCIVLKDGAQDPTSYCSP